MTSVDYSRLEQTKKRSSPLTFNSYSELLTKSSITTIMSCSGKNLSTEEGCQLLGKSPVPPCSSNNLFKKSSSSTIMSAPAGNLSAEEKFCSSNNFAAKIQTIFDIFNKNRKIFNHSRIVECRDFDENLKIDIIHAMESGKNFFIE